MACKICIDTMVVLFRTGFKLVRDTTGTLISKTITYTAAGLTISDSLSVELLQRGSVRLQADLVGRCQNAVIDQRSAFGVCSVDRGPLHDSPLFCFSMCSIWIPISILAVDSDVFIRIMLYRWPL